MVEKIDLSLITPRALEYARQIRKIAAFLESIDALEGEDVPGWNYMGARFFDEERNSLLDVADILDQELAPEAARYCVPFDFGPSD